MDLDGHVTEAERRQLDFDARMEVVRREGADAQRAGLSREECPYTAPSERQIRTNWIGGWAEAALGLEDEGLNGPRR